MIWKSENCADWLAPCGTALALIACYGTLAVVGVLSLAGITVAVHEGLWAGVIALFSILALAGIFIGWRGHRKMAPLLLGVLGAGMILWTMGLAYSRVVEIAGFIILVVAAVLDWRAKRHRRSHA